MNNKTIPPGRTARSVIDAIGASALMLGIFFLCSCVAPSGSRPVPLYEVKAQISQYVSSGRYEAEVRTVFERAKIYLQQRARAGGKLAIVLDIDETVLSNVGLLKLNDWTLFLTGPTNSVTGPCSLLEWIRLERGDPIRPALELIGQAHAQGVAVFLITARPESLRGPTERKLHSIGCQWTGLILKPSKLKVKSEVEYKAPARQRLVDQGYAVLMTVGDQQSDLAGGCAERTFKLPNPFYFAP